MNVLEEFNFLLSYGIDTEQLQEIIPRIKEYLSECPEDEKEVCKMRLSNAEQLLEHHLQIKLIYDYVTNNQKCDEVELEYIEPFGNSYGVYIKVSNYVMELVYKPMDDPEKNEIRTKIFIDVSGLYKQFVLRKDIVKPEYINLQNKRRDYYPTHVSYHDWGETMIRFVKLVKRKPSNFLQMCQFSCPFHNDGTHKYKSWKTRAKVEITYEADAPLIQGIKKDTILIGSNIVGGNGSYRQFNKGNYVLKIVVDSLACEKPVRQDLYVDVDDYMRQLKEERGWGRNMPYNKVNSALTGKVEVITHDMNKDPEDRTFYPIEYDGNWINFLKEKLSMV